MANWFSKNTTESVGWLKNWMIVVLVVLLICALVAGLVAGLYKGKIPCRQPNVTATLPDAVCTAQRPVWVQLSGSNFMNADGKLPKVYWKDVLQNNKFPRQLTDCRKIKVYNRKVRACNMYNSTLSPNATLATRIYSAPFLIQNQDPCKSSFLYNLTDIPPPRIDRIFPAAVCVNSAADTSVAQDVLLEGDFFVQYKNTDPSYSWNTASGITVNTARSTALYQSCYATPTTGVRACKQVVLRTQISGITSTQFLGAAIPSNLTVTNPPPVDCSTVLSQPLVVAQRPVVLDVFPRVLCSGNITVTGTFYTYGTTLPTIEKQLGIDTVTATSVDNCTTVSIVGVADGTVKECNIAVFDIPELWLSAGANQVTLRSAAPLACDSDPFTLTQPAVYVYFADPPVVWNGINTGVNVFSSGAAATSVSVQLINNETAEVLNVTSNIIGNKYVQIVVPRGTPAGFYDVRVILGTGCSGTLAQGLTVVENATLTINSIVPSYAWVSTVTPVNIFSNTSFIDTPRVFLSPSGNNNLTAFSLLGASFTDSSTLAAVVPSTLSVAVYDVVVVNPNGQVGVLINGLHVVANAPPVITNVSPASLGGTFTSATITGQNFAGASVQFLCPTVQSAPYNATVNSQSATSIAFTAPTIGGTGSVLCELRVINSDGAFASYFSVNRPGAASGNLVANTAQTSFVTARRNHALVVGKPTAANRFLYAIGGDTAALATSAAPTAAQALQDVESASVKSDGTMGSWSVQRYALPSKCSQGGAVTISQYIYLVCGHTGSAVSGTVYRAQILDPLVVPRVDVSLDVQQNDTGVPPGRYVYKVSAVFPDTFTENPAGESLPSEPITLSLPTIENGGLRVTLSWTALPGASSYNIYRSPSAGAPSNQLVLIGSTNTGSSNVSFEDDGIVGNPSAAGPLSTGSLGQWANLGALKTPRTLFGIAAAFDPTVANTYSIYVVAGRDASNVALGDIESAVVTVTPHTTGSLTQEGAANTPFDVVATTGPTARFGLGAFTATKANNPAITSANDTWLYAFGDINSVVNEAWLVGTNGTLGARVTVNGQQSTLEGYCAGTANDFVYTIGGNSGSASGSSGKFCTSGGGVCTAGAPPDHLNMNAGFSLTRARKWLACATDGIYQFFTGGYSDTGAALVPFAESNYCCQ